MSKAEFRRQRRKNGLCAFCGLESKTFSCGPCRDKANELRRSLSAKRRSVGLCACGRSVLGRRSKCEKCIRSGGWGTTTCTPERRDVLWIEQDGKCAVCDEPLKDRWAAYGDHNHTNGNPRGLLCARCNTAIGFIEKRPWLLDAAEAYLDRYAANGGYTTVRS